MVNTGRKYIKKLIVMSLVYLLIVGTFGTTSFASNSNVLSQHKEPHNKLSLGGQHLGVVNDSGELMTWGNNYSNKLGLGTSFGSRVTTPTKMTLPEDLVAIEYGDPTGGYISKSGKLYTWGYNVYGTLGHGDTVSQSSPKEVAGLSNVVAISFGEKTSAAITSDGKLYTWGVNDVGQLGIGSTVNKTSPTLVSGISDVVAVSMEGSNGGAITSDGSLYMWGKNTNGNLGIGTGWNNLDSTRPIKVDSLSNVTAISLGAEHASAITSDGSLYTWGSNNGSQLGDGTTVTSATPKKITTISDVKHISNGSYYSTAITKDGKLYTWGINSNSQLGHGTGGIRNVPTHLVSLTDVVTVSASAVNVAAVTSDGKLYTWGDNGQGQIGDGGVTTRHVPYLVTGLTVDTTVPATPPTGGTVGNGSITKDAEVDINAGELKLTVPNVVPFPTSKLQGTTFDILTKLDSNIEVSDSRGSGDGWRLSLTTSTFKTTINGSEYTLPSGVLSIKKPNSISNAVNGSSTGLNILMSTEFTNVDGLGTIPIASAEIGFGKGLTDIVFDTNDVLKLNVNPDTVLVDKASKQSKYTATMTWSLTEAP